MKARLIERDANCQMLREIPLSQDEFLIGRGTDCDLRIPISSISRHHCLIRVVNDEAMISDLGSANGTFVNGQRVRSQSNLKNGDDLQIGDCRFLVELGERMPIEFDTPAGGDPFARTMKLPPGLVGKKPNPPTPPVAAEDAKKGDTA